MSNVWEFWCHTQGTGKVSKYRETDLLILAFGEKLLLKKTQNHARLIFKLWVFQKRYIVVS